MSRFRQANQTIEAAVVGGYKKIENGVVSGYQRVEERFITAFLAHEGESVQQARARLQEKTAQKQENKGRNRRAEQ